jgi:hypothetical protein
MTDMTPEEAKKWLPEKWKGAEWQAKHQAYCCVLPSNFGVLSGKTDVERGQEMNCLSLECQYLEEKP